MDVFISYARQDETFVARLADQFRAAKKDVWVDTERLFAGEKWLDRIAAVITAADHFLFVLSPHSVQSEVCRQELNLAIAKNKRILPVLISDPPKSIPAELTAINWFRFNNANEENETEFSRLLQALTVDPEWVHAHTRFAVRAAEWQTHHDESRLLRGQELLQAKQWLKSYRQGGTPTPTSDQIAYIEASVRFEHDEAERRAQLDAVVQARRLAPLAAARLIRGEYRLAFLLAAASWESHSNDLAQKVLFDFLNKPYDYEEPRPEEGRSVWLTGHRTTFLAWGGEFRGGSKEIDEVGKTAREFITQDVTHDIQASDDGQLVLTVSRYSGRVLTVWKGSDKLWDVESKEPISAASFSPQVDRILLASWDGTVKVFDILGQLVTTLQHPDFVYDAKFSRSGTRIVSSCRDGMARLWETSGALVVDCVASIDAVADVSPEATRLVASHKKGAAVWDSTGKLLAYLSLPFPARHVAWSPSGDRIATAQDVDSVAVWEVDDEVVTRRWRLFGNSSKELSLRRIFDLSLDGWIRSVRFSPDGRMLMAVSEANDLDSDYTRRNGPSTARIWNFDGKVLGDLSHSSKINCARFAPDGTFVATASRDRTARTWRLKRKPLAVLQHTNRVNDTTFFPDDKGILTASADGILKIWGCTANRNSYSILGHIFPPLRSALRAVLY